MQVILNQQEYEDLLTYKRAASVNNYVIVSWSSGFSSTYEGCCTATRDEVIEKMEAENKRLTKEIEELKNKLRKWWIPR